MHCAQLEVALKQVISKYGIYHTVGGANDEFKEKKIILWLFINLRGYWFWKIFKNWFILHIIHTNLHIIHINFHASI